MRRFFVFVSLLLFFSSCGQKTNSEITGEIKAANNTFVYLERMDVEASSTIDSMKINRNGHFSFKVFVEQPTFYSLRFANKERVSLVVLPDEKQEISGTLEDIKNNYWVDGSEHSLWIKLLNFQLQRTTSVTDSILKAYTALPPEAVEERAAYNLGWEEVLQKQINFTREFIMKHAISPASYYALYQKITPDIFIMDEIDDYHYYKIVASSMQALYPESQYTRALMKHLKQISQNIGNQQLINAIKASPTALPNIELPDRKGNQVALNSLKNKLIIIDFTLLTASDNQAHIRELKQIYDKYRRKGVEIYQVCMDKSKLRWEAAADQFKIDWICVWDEEALQSRAARSWNVREIPANYIINQQQEIVGKNLYGDRLEDRLKDLLNQ